MTHANADKGSIDLQNGQIIPVKTAVATAEHPAYTNELSQDQLKIGNESTPFKLDTHSPSLPKRRKTASGLHPVKQSVSASSLTPEAEGNDNEPSSVRQLHTETRFPQRKKPGKDAPVLEPTSTDKLIAGIWKQLFSSVHLTRSSSVC